MDIHQIGEDVTKVIKSVTELKPSLVGSFCTSSEAGSGRILAEEGKGVGSWALMWAVESVLVVTTTGDSKGRVEICNPYHHLNTKEVDLVKHIAEGFRNDIAPERTGQGLGGTYFVSNGEKRKVAIFKPCDEEPLAPCNPNGFVGRRLGDPGLKPTVRVGEAALREAAAYLLDRDHFAKVPTTLLMRASHPVFNYTPESANCPSLFPGSAADGDTSELRLKVGSIQEFITHLCDSTEMGTSRFTRSDVQRIAILDIRLYNTDRHAGNILVRKIDTSGQTTEPFKDKGYELIPIDHGFCLPEALEPPYFEWQHWSQARMPLGQEELDFIHSIDIEAEKDTLRRELPIIREESLRTMEVATTLLKMCAAAGLFLNEIAEIMTQPLVGMDEEISDLEKMCRECKEAITAQSLTGLEINWVSTTTDEDSDYLESAETLAATPRRIDELQFCIELNEPVKGIQSGNTPHQSAVPHETAERHFQQGRPGLEQPTLECPRQTSTEAMTNIPGPRTALRSLSMALPASSTCCRALNRGFNGQRTRRTHRPTAESPQEMDQRVTYPPLVHGSAPGSTDDLFRQMSRAQWRRFMELLEAKIDEGLKGGRWKLNDASSQPFAANLGISCPRF